MPPSDSVELHYTEEERMPVPMACNIHPWMRGHLLLRNSPYMAKSDEQGRFVIKNLPVGKRVFRLWHERTGYLRNVSIGPLETDSRGSLEIVIQPGTNNLEDIRLAPSLFEVKPDS